MHECKCVSNHNPAANSIELHHVHPQYADGPDTLENLEPLCPTAHSDTHKLIRLYAKFKGLPPWEYRRMFNPYVRYLAARGWVDMQTAGYQGRHY